MKAEGWQHGRNQPRNQLPGEFTGCSAIWQAVVGGCDPVWALSVLSCLPGVTAKRLRLASSLGYHAELDKAWHWLGTGSATHPWIRSLCVQYKPSFWTGETVTEPLSMGRCHRERGKLTPPTWSGVWRAHHSPVLLHLGLQQKLEC